MASEETLEKEGGLTAPGKEEPEAAGVEPVEESKEGKAEEAHEKKGEGAAGEAEEERGDEGEEEKGVEEGLRRGGGGKRGRGKKRGRPSLESTHKKKTVEATGGGEKTPTTDKKKKKAVVESVERPSRERKTVERYSAISPKKPPTPKVVSIQQGPGTKLKDIPNVLFKLNKRKVDENLHLLHAILFGKKGKARIVKKNIVQFSGFVWTANEEKQRAKVRERLDKCGKDKILDFCDLLDLSSTRYTMRKEELSAKLFEFLESPFVTRDVLLSEKKSKKRKKNQAASRSSGKKMKRGRKPKSQDEEVKKEENEAESADEKGRSSDADVPMDNSDVDADDDVDTPAGSESESEDEKPSPAKKSKSDKKPKKGKSKEIEGEISQKADSSVKSPKSIHSKQDASNETPKKAPKSPKEKPPVKRASSKSGSESTAKSKEQKNKKPKVKQSPGKKQGKKQAATPVKSSKAKGDVLQPTREEIHAVVSDILKEVDFNTATLADILRQLGSHFKTDLISRKAEIKSIIEDVINSMSTDDEEEDGDEAKVEDGGKEEKKGDDDSKCE